MDRGVSFSAANRRGVSRRIPAWASGLGLVISYCPFFPSLHVHNLAHFGSGCQHGKGVFTVACCSCGAGVRRTGWCRRPVARLLIRLACWAQGGPLPHPHPRSFSLREKEEAFGKGSGRFCEIVKRVRDDVLRSGSGPGVCAVLLVLAR